VRRAGEPSARRAAIRAGADLACHTSFDAKVRQAQAAETRKVQYLALPDSFGTLRTDLDPETRASSARTVLDHLSAAAPIWSDLRIPRLSARCI
jgi:hypothetical protein